MIQLPPTTRMIAKFFFEELDTGEAGSVTVALVLPLASMLCHCISHKSSKFPDQQIYVQVVSCERNGYTQASKTPRIFCAGEGYRRLSGAQMTGKTYFLLAHFAVVTSPKLTHERCILSSRRSELSFSNSSHIRLGLRAGEAAAMAGEACRIDARAG